MTVYAHCPYCGNSDQARFINEYTLHAHQVRCASCGAQGPPDTIPELGDARFEVCADAGWNMRTATKGQPFAQGMTKEEQVAMEREIGDLLYKTDGMHEEAKCKSTGERILKLMVRKLRPELFRKMSGHYLRPDEPRGEDHE